ncbi:sodium-independent anion transporter [Deltaproteobacteria bacterium]|nr:sodium-independent anion transporter [Deltaproteobacteria bacterium]
MNRHFFQPKLIDCLKSYSLAAFKRDLAAGLVVGVVAIPLAIAFAIASGVNPAAGLVTAVTAGLIVSLLGGSKVVIGGPTGAFVVIILAIVQQYGLENLLICTIMAGIILLVMGLTRLGFFVNYIPYPVISGFTNGIAVVIISTQLKDFLGLVDLPANSGFLASVAAVLSSLNQVHYPTLALAAAGLLAVRYWPKALARFVPGPIAVLALGTLAVWLLDVPTATIGSRFGHFQGGWPPFRLPELNLKNLQFLLGPALTIAFLGALESLLCAVVADGMIGDRHDPNQELMAQGLANIAAPFFGGLPATGAIVRTAANIRHGGSTPVAGLVHALVCLTVLLAAQPLIKSMPLAILSAILINVALNMGQWREFTRLKRYPRSDDTVLLLTFSLTVLFDLTVAVEVGVIAAAVLFIKRMAKETDVEIRPMVLAVDELAEADPTHGVNEEIMILQIHGEMFFGAAHKLQTALRYIRKKRPKVMIIKMKYVFSIDASTLVALDDIVANARRRDVAVFISGLSRQPWEVVKKSDLYARLGPEAFFPDQASALAEACRLVARLHRKDPEPEVDVLW